MSPGKMISQNIKIQSIEADVAKEGA